MVKTGRFMEIWGSIRCKNFLKTWEVKPENKSCVESILIIWGWHGNMKEDDKMIIQKFTEVPKIAWNVPQYNVPGIQVPLAPKCAKRESSEHALHDLSATTMKNALCLGCILNLPCSRKLERHFYDLFLDAFSLTQWLQVACGSCVHWSSHSF